MARGSRLGIQVAQEIRATWLQQIDRINRGEITPKKLRDEFAERYGVCERSIFNVLVGRTWPDPDR